MKNTWLWLGGLALAAWYFLRKKPSQIATVNVVLPLITEGGPWGAWTTVTNTSGATQSLTAMPTGDVLGSQLAFSPPSLAFDLVPGGVWADSFWFSIPTGFVGTSGSVTVTVRDAQGNTVATDTQAFIVGTIP